MLFHFLLLMLSRSIKNIVQHLRLDNCGNFELAWKETIDWQIKMEYVFFFEDITTFLVSIGNHLVV